MTCACNPRDAVRANIRANSDAEPVEQVIEFGNDEVASYLEWLLEFQEKSSEAEIIVGANL